MNKAIICLVLLIVFVNVSFGLSRGIMLEFPKNYKQTIKIGLWDIGISYKFWNFGMQVQADWIPYIFGVYNLSSKLSYSFLLDQGRDISIGVGIKGYYDNSFYFIKDVIGYELNMGLNGYKIFITTSFNLISYDKFTFGFYYSSLKREYVSRDFIGSFFYSYFLSFLDGGLKVPFFGEFVYSVNGDYSFIGFGNLYSRPYSISFGFLLSFFKETFNIKLGGIYPGIKLLSNELIGFSGLDLPLLPYIDIYFRF